MNQELVNCWDDGIRRAYIIGASRYRHPLIPLETPENDATDLADLLASSHKYHVRRLIEDVSIGRIRGLLKTMQREVGERDRVIFYFAGHGVPPDDEGERAGYLLPESADRHDRDSFLGMQEVGDELQQLPCRHLLVILDCCFAGSFRWARTRPSRDLSAVPEPRIYSERFQHFLRRRAWQLLTSAGAAELAADVLFGRRDEGRTHSPFAQALLDGLGGRADRADGASGADGVITLTELYAYLFQRAIDDRIRQTARYYPLERHEDGEYMFLSPWVSPGALDLPSAVRLEKENNPYLGLMPYDYSESHERLLFGRNVAKRELADFVRSHR